VLKFSSNKKGMINMPFSDLVSKNF